MKTAVIRFSALGDIAGTLPFLRALKTRPVIITTPMGRELLRDEFDQFLLLRSKRLPDILRLIKEIRSRRFEMLLDLQNNDRSWMIDFLSGAKQTFTNKGMPRRVSNEENMLRVLQPSGQLGPLDTAFTPKPFDYIVLNTGSSEKWKSKRLPTQKWQEFASQLLDRFNLPFVLTGSADEADYVSALASELPGRLRNLAGKTSLQELKTVLNKAFLTVSTDSAAMHLSAAMKTPTIGLFGATNWHRFAPLGPWATSLYDPTVYPDGTSPPLTLENQGAYYDHIDLQTGLLKLAPFLKHDD